MGRCSTPPAALAGLRGPASLRSMPAPALATGPASGWTSRRCAIRRRIAGSGSATWSPSAGSQFAAVALPYQVYRQTGSSLQVGLIGLAVLGPLLVGALASGAIADAFDRRRLLLASQSTSAARLRGAGAPDRGRPAAAGRAVPAGRAAGVRLEHRVAGAKRGDPEPGRAGAGAGRTRRSTRPSTRSRRSRGRPWPACCWPRSASPPPMSWRRPGSRSPVLVALGLPSLLPAGGAVAPGWAALMDGSAVRPPPAGAAGHLPGRPERDGVRDAAGAVPGPGGRPRFTSARRAWACSTRRRRWARCWPRSRSGWVAARAPPGRRGDGVGRGVGRGRSPSSG